jgi:membrane-associated phospholipid phosphatase
MASAQEGTAARALWPIDKLFIANSFIQICLLSIAARNDARALLFIAVHMAAIGVLLALSRSTSALWGFARHWFLLAYLPLCYKGTPFLVTALGLHSDDVRLAGWDMAMWKIDPVFWLSDFQSRGLVELLQVVYTLFIPGVVGLGILLWLRRPKAEFRYGTFLISATFLISYLGYLILPARGPRFMPIAAQHPLHGLWLFTFFQGLLDTLEGTQYDCFPSGHVAVVLVGCYLARQISPRAFRAFSVFAALITFSTVYLRYHYLIDVIAGMVLAITVIAVAPWIYPKLGSVKLADK